MENEQGNEMDDQTKKLKNEKLSLEISQLKKPLWKRPEVYAPILSSFFAIGSLIFVLDSGVINAERKILELDIKQFRATKDSLMDNNRILRKENQLFRDSMEVVANERKADQWNMRKIMNELDKKTLTEAELKKIIKDLLVREQETSQLLRAKDQALLLIGKQSHRVPAIPMDFVINQNYPNPFDSVTTISFSIPREDTVSLFIYNQLGEKVRTLFHEKIRDGYHSKMWDGKDDAGNILPSAIYHYTIRVGSFVDSKKMVKRIRLK